MNRIVRHAVLEARTAPVTTNVLDASTCEGLEADLDGWSLPPAVEAFGKLIATYPDTFQKPILTTNFDPLIKIATNRAGRQSRTIFLIRWPFRQHSRHHFCQGRSSPWVLVPGTDTLHTPQQLTRERPRLKGCLRDLLRDTTLVVVGYGGWDDVITRTLFRGRRRRKRTIGRVVVFLPRQRSHHPPRKRNPAQSHRALGRAKDLALQRSRLPRIFPALVSKPASVFPASSPSLSRSSQDRRRVRASV